MNVKLNDDFQHIFLVNHYKRFVKSNKEPIVLNRREIALCRKMMRARKRRIYTYYWQEFLVILERIDDRYVLYFRQAEHPTYPANNVSGNLKQRG